MNSFYRLLPVLYCAKENPKATGLVFKKGYFEGGGHIGLTSTFEEMVSPTKGMVHVHGTPPGYVQPFTITVRTHITISHKDFKEQYLIKGIEAQTSTKIREFYERIKNEQWLVCYR